MIAVGDAGSATQDHLVDHELAVVFANRAFRRAIAGIGVVRRLSPFPDVAEQLQPRPPSCGQRAQKSLFAKIAAGGQQLYGGVLPLEFGRKTFAGPAGESVCFVVAHMADRRFAIDGLEAVQCHCEPVAALLTPVERRAPAFLTGALPSVGEPVLWSTVAPV